LVFHGDGKLTSDWEAEDEVTTMYLQDKVPDEDEVMFEDFEDEDEDLPRTAPEDMDYIWAKIDDLKFNTKTSTMTGCGMPKGCG
jgi:hypothetical protein